MLHAFFDKENERKKKLQKLLPKRSKYLFACDESIDTRKGKGIIRISFSHKDHDDFP